MLSHKKYDFLVIGAGIIGLSVSKELIQRFPHAKIALIEKEATIGLHASGRNSGVLHSGIYYSKDSLKATVCAEGARRMLAFANENHIPYKKTGKLIIATDASNLPALQTLLENAKNNKITAYALDLQEMKKLEPYATPFEQGIYTPDTACIDSLAVLNTLKKQLTKQGVDFYLQNKVCAFHPKTNTLQTTREKFNYHYVFNCAGSGTDQIAKLFGLAKEYRLLPFKGIYYQLKKEKAHLVNSNIYPVPNLNLPFLGVHFTRSIHAQVYIGPTAMPAFGRENYRFLRGIDFEGLRIAKDIAMMYALNQQNFRQLIHTEIKKYRKSHFLQAAQKLVATITADDLLATQKVGIRPQLIHVPTKKIEMDYIIEQGENSLHVLNAISPAFTSAFAFAEYLV